ncbi:MAG: VOC family protein [Pseudomonadota bacterium]
MLPPIVPYLTVKDARSALDFYGRALGAETLMILEEDSVISHARARIAGGVIMLYEEKTGAPDSNRAPEALGGSPVAIRLELRTAERVDATAAQCIEAGAETVIAPTDRPWGRLAEIRDPQGHIWRLAASTVEE